MKKQLMLAAAMAVLGGASAAAQTISVRVDRGLGSITESEKLWTSTMIAPRVTLSADGGNILENGYDLLTFNTAAATRKVTVGTPNEYYYVSGVSFKVKGVSGDVVTVSSGSTSVTTNSSLQDFSVTFTQRQAAEITFVPSVAEAKKAQFSDFIVTLSPRQSHSVDEPLSRAGWTVTACSSAPSESGSTGGSNPGTGNINNVIDDAPTSYWHNNWSAAGCNETSPSRHWFLVDLGSEQTFNYCSFQQRNASAWNGAFAEVSVFVGNSSFNVTHGTIADFLENNTPAVSATLETTSSEVQYVQFPQAQTGRYILVVPTHTVNPNVSGGSSSENKYACLADFGVGTRHSEEWNLTMISAAEANSRIEAARNSNAYAEWKGLLYDDEIIKEIITPEYTGDVVSDMIDDVVSQICDPSTFMPLADGRVIYIKNLRRSDANGKYLGVMADGKVNSYTYPCERAKWYVQRASATSEDFYLVNPETRGYLKAGQNSVVTDKSNATTFLLKQIDYNNSPASAFKNAANDNGLNLDQSNNPLADWGYADGGSAWAISLAGTKAAALKTDGTYYRIRSNRGLSKMLDGVNNGSLLGIYPLTNNDLTAQPVNTRKDGLGTLWSIETAESAGAGHVRLRNAAADFDGKEGLSYFGRKETGSGKEPRWGYVKKDGDGMAMQLVNAIGATNSDYAGNHPYAIGVYTPNFTGNGSTYHYMDNDGNGYPVFSEWKPGSEKTDNGSIYYFEEVTAEEVEALKSEYYTAVDELCALVDYNGYEPIFGDAFAKVIDATEELFVTTVKEANTRLDDIRSGKFNEEKAPVTAMADAVLANPLLGAMADGREVQIISVGRPGNKLNAGTDGNASATNAAADISTVWVLNHVDGLDFTLRNHGTNTYLGHYDRTNGGNDGSQPVPMVSADEAQAYTIGLIGGGKFTLSAGEGNYPGLHYNGNLVKWDNTNSNSHWTASVVDAAPLEIDIDVTDPEHVKIFFYNTSGDIAANEARGDHHVITIDRVATEPVMLRSLSVPHTFATTTEEEDGTHSIDLSSLEAGEYTIAVPTGFFVANGKLSAKSSATFNREGELTGIAEVETCDSADAEWFTVQGVRVASPRSGGIYLKRSASGVTKTYVK